LKKLFKILGISLLLLFLFRGLIFRSLINYKEIKERKTVEIYNKKLIDEIELKIQNKKLDINGIVNISNEITTELLSFTFGTAPNDPNNLLENKLANCVGYSAMFNSVANYLILKSNLEEEIQANHKVGEMIILGVNLNSLFANPFFRNHDYNEILGLSQNKRIYVDSSIGDFLKFNATIAKDRNE